MSGLATIAVTPALPLHEAGKYVAAAYIFAFVLVLVYVAIMAIRLGRVERELGELLELAEDRARPAGFAAEPSAPRTREPVAERAHADPSEPVGAPTE